MLWVRQGQGVSQKRARKGPEHGERTRLLPGALSSIMRPKLCGPWSGVKGRARAR